MVVLGASYYCSSPLATQFAALQPENWSTLSDRFERIIPYKWGFSTPLLRVILVLSENLFRLTLNGATTLYYGAFTNHGRIQLCIGEAAWGLFLDTYKIMLYFDGFWNIKTSFHECCLKMNVFCDNCFIKFCLLFWCIFIQETSQLFLWDCFLKSFFLRKVSKLMYFIFLN